VVVEQSLYAGEVKLVHMANKSDEELSILMFFPEVIGVAACVVFSPFWSMRLFHRGHFLYGVSVLLVAILGTFCFWQCVARRRRFIAWLIMLGMFASFLALHSLLPQTEGFLNTPPF